MLHYNEKTNILWSDSLGELNRALSYYAGGSASSKMDDYKSLERFGHAVSANGCEIIWTKKCHPRYLQNIQ